MMIRRHEQKCEATRSDPDRGTFEAIVQYVGGKARLGAFRIDFHASFLVHGFYSFVHAFRIVHETHST